MLRVMQSKTNCIHPSKWVDPTEADDQERLVVLLETEQNTQTAKPFTFVVSMNNYLWSVLHQLLCYYLSTVAGEPC